MLYDNNDLRLGAVYDSELYKEDTNSGICPVCGMINPELFFVRDDGECIGCCECVHDVYAL